MLLFLMCLSCIDAATFSWHTTQFAGHERIYDKYVPDSYFSKEDTSNHLGLIVSMHGWTDTAGGHCRRDVQADTLADELNVVVICPQGLLPARDGYFWRAYPGGAPYASGNIMKTSEDMDFLKQLIKDVQKEYGIAQNSKSWKNTLIGGCSNGGSSVWRFACSRNDNAMDAQELVDGLVVVCQSFFDPVSGWGKPFKIPMCAEQLPLFMLVGTEDWAFKNSYYSTWDQYSRHVLQCNGHLHEKVFLDESFPWGACACDEYLDCGNESSIAVKSRLCSVQGANHDCTMSYPSWKMAWQYLEVEMTASSTSENEGRSRHGSRAKGRGRGRGRASEKPSAKQKRIRMQHFKHWNHKQEHRGKSHRKNHHWKNY
eukprot:gnl/MRDRNA2_/MRDRNA2_143026_c0_seq1.p1 gnl/MRDRNA2_/MRDRNA2_143026_c0~~gnl/MRDRNA2_/MRDRNA2_143026_c0_seq1.p1  ORF type:complete len:370 (-),score=51.18 gnl/MRDRNA2_/MRDRNA2_143026_c0_seq1:466-1575(-)